MHTGVSIVFDLEKDQELVWGSGTGRGRLGSLGGDGRVWLHQAADGREHCSGVCVLSVHSRSLHALFTPTSVQFSPVAQSCPTLCDPMNLSTPGLPVHHQLPEFTQTHVH